MTCWLLPCNCRRVKSAIKTSYSKGGTAMAIASWWIATSLPEILVITEGGAGSERREGTKQGGRLPRQYLGFSFPGLGLVREPRNGSGRGRRRAALNHALEMDVQAA